MDVVRMRDWCLEKGGVTEEFPFGDDVLVFKVSGKIFGLLNLVEIPAWMNLKCDPERAIDLRERYAGVQPAYHMNKTHWNSVYFDGSVPDAEILELVDHSYDLVVRGLKRADREALRSGS